LELRPAICICVFGSRLFPDVPDLHLDFRLRSENRLELTDHLQIHTLELPKYIRPADNELIERPMEQWAYFLKYATSSTPEELVRRLGDRVFARAIGVLEMIAKNPAERAIYELRMKTVRDEAWRVEQAKAEGKAVGKAEGKAEGEVIGEERGKAIGVAEGQKIAFIKTLQMLQELTGEAVSSGDSLSSLSLDELERLITECRDKLRGR
jgi:predicted transposase/invertase (TIGR01784 family)